jgi:ribosomal protein S18 acetylase RimI-like enzyme
MASRFGHGFSYVVQRARVFLRMIKGEVTRAVGRLRAADFPHPESLVPRALPWVLAAGNPYYDYLFGEAAFSYRTLEGWMKRASSEVSILRGEFLTWDAELAGGFIALNGVELKRARQADAGALWEAFPSAERAALVERMANSANLFPPVADDEYYLSKMGLGAPYRGQGLGGALVQQFLAQGKAQNYARFRLDVHAENQPAIRCYQAAGFKVLSTSQSRDGGLRYQAMLCELETA